MLYFINIISLKRIVNNSNNIFLWHESEDINKQTNKQTKTKQNKQDKKQKTLSYFQNFTWFQFYVCKLFMIMCIGYSID